MRKFNLPHSSLDRRQALKAGSAAALTGVATLAALSSLGAGPARAQTTATPIRLIVPFTPGTGIDLIGPRCGHGAGD